MTVSLLDIQNAVMPAAIRRDPPRHEERVRVRVNVRPNATTIPGHTGRVKRGVQEVVVCRSDLPAIQSRVETEEAAYEECKQRVEREREAWIKERLVGTPTHALEQRRAELFSHWQSMGSDYGDGSNRLTNAEAYFTQRFGRGVRPLIGKVEVLEDGIDPEKTEEQKRFEAIIEKLDAQQSATVNALSTAITDGINKIVSALVDSRAPQQQQRK